MDVKIDQTISSISISFTSQTRHDNLAGYYVFYVVLRNVSPAATLISIQLGAPPESARKSCHWK